MAGNLNAKKYLEDSPSTYDKTSNVLVEEAILNQQPKKNKEITFKDKESEKDCLDAILGEDEEATPTEIAVMAVIPMYIFCSKLGWPFCCLCV